MCRQFHLRKQVCIAAIVVALVGVSLHLVAWQIAKDVVTMSYEMIAENQTVVVSSVEMKKEWPWNMGITAKDLHANGTRADNLTIDISISPSLWFNLFLVKTSYLNSKMLTTATTTSVRVPLVYTFFKGPYAELHLNNFFFQKLSTSGNKTTTVTEDVYASFHLQQKSLYMEVVMNKTEILDIMDENIFGKQIDRIHLQGSISSKLDWPRGVATTDLENQRLNFLKQVEIHIDHLSVIYGPLNATFTFNVVNWKLQGTARMCNHGKIIDLLKKWKWLATVSTLFLEDRQGCILMPISFYGNYLQIYGFSVLKVDVVSWIQELLIN